MRVSRILAAVASATIVTTITTNPTASARDRTHRADSTHSVIVWSRFVDSDFSGARIVAKSPHGHRTRMLSDPGDGVQDIDPEVSPDGQRVAFERDLPDGSTQIVVMGSNGRYEHALDLGCVDPCEVDLSPTWSRDSRHLFFTRVVGPFNAGNAASAVLYRTDLDGAHITRVSEPGIDGTFEDYSASVAPAGYIVFVRGRNADLKSAVFRMSSGAGHVRRLTPWRLSADLPEISPATSGPTQDLVVFETYGHGAPNGKAQAIATVSAACSARHRIRYLTSPTSLPIQNFNPAWSPDGRSVAFVRFKFVASEGVPHGDIWTMSWDGRHREQVSHSPLFEFRPDWGTTPRR